jgi:hypothetical protein
MGGKSGKTQSTVTQSSLPKYAQPYYERIMQKAEGIADTPYQAYGGPRVAGFSGDQNAAFQGMRDLQTPGSLTTAQNYGLAAMQQAMGTHYDPHAISTGDFDGAAADRYMSPYMSRVLALQKQGAVQDWNNLRSDRNTAAVNAGAFGGDRRFVTDMLGERNLQSQLANIDANGMQAAWQQAQGQFNADRSQSFQTQDANEGLRQIAAQLGLQGAQLGIQGSQGLADMAGMQHQMELDKIKGMSDIGAQQQAQQQKNLDVAYQDFLTQQNYPKEQAAWMSGMLHGTAPIQPNTTVSTPNGNPLAQAAGAGLTGIGMAKAMGA